MFVRRLAGKARAVVTHISSHCGTVVVSLSTFFALAPCRCVPHDATATRDGKGRSRRWVTSCRVRTSFGKVLASFRVSNAFSLTLGRPSVAAFRATTLVRRCSMKRFLTLVVLGSGLLAMTPAVTLADGHGDEM